MIDFKILGIKYLENEYLCFFLLKLALLHLFLDFA